MNRIIEKLHEIEGAQRNLHDPYEAALVGFAVEVANCLLELEQEIRDIKEQFPERFV